MPAPYKLDFALAGSLRGFLKDLGGAELKRLRLRPVSYQAGDLLCRRNDRNSEVVFLQSGVAALMCTLENGKTVASCHTSAQSVTNIAPVVGATACEHDAVMLLGGWGYACAAQDAALEFRRGELFQRLLLQFLTLQLSELARIVGCVSRHSVQERLCSCLLMLLDATGSSDLQIGVPALASSIGATPQAVSLACDLLENKGALLRTPGNVKLLSIAMLEDTACACSPPAARLTRHVLSSEASGKIRSARGLKRSLDQMKIADSPREYVN